MFLRPAFFITKNNEMLKKHLILHKTKGLSETEWQALRKSFATRGMIGGSDAGTLLGFNKWKSPLSLYYQSLDLSPIPNKMNMEMLMGKLQEANIAESWQYYSEDQEQFISNVITKTRVRRYREVKAIIENPKYPLLFANIDGLITKHPERKKKGILEIKKINGVTVDSYVGGLPPQYIAQVQHYMLVCELPYAELCMRVDGKELKVHMIEEDKFLQQAILHYANDFNQRVMSARSAISNNGSADIDTCYQIASEFEPDADGSEDFNAFISEKHRLRESENQITLGLEEQSIAEKYMKAQGRIKEAEADKLLHGNVLKQIMEKNNASVMNLPDGKITWRKQFLVKLNK